jgi:hypothetical protein
MSLPLNAKPEPYQSLIDSAETWHEQGHYKEAVIIAQTALELFTEKTLGELYHSRRIEYLKPVFEDLLINYNLANTKVSGVYVALSGDPIRQAPFWAALQDHAELRNKLVHDGQDATKEQSRRSLEAVKAAISHVLNMVLGRGSSMYNGSQ